MAHFSEDFVGGWFGFGRTYGASVRFECQSASDLHADWPGALASIAKWHQQREERATAVSLFFQVEATWLWDAIQFIKTNVIVPPNALALELHGLFLRVYVMSRDLEHYMYAEMYPEATGLPESPSNNH